MGLPWQYPIYAYVYAQLGRRKNNVKLKQKLHR